MNSERPVIRKGQVKSLAVNDAQGAGEVVERLFGVAA
jgi:hypothetical protein